MLFAPCVCWMKIIDKIAKKKSGKNRDDYHHCWWTGTVSGSSAHLQTCGCGPVLCMACMSPAVDSELCSKKAWYFYDVSKLEHHSSTLMKLQSRAITFFLHIFFSVSKLVMWPPTCHVISCNLICTMIQHVFNNFLSLSILWDGSWTLNTATAMSSQERSLFLFFTYFFVIL